MNFLESYKTFEDNIFIPKNINKFNKKYNNESKIIVNIFSKNLKFLSMNGSLNLLNKGVGKKIKIKKKKLLKINSCNNNIVFKKIYPNIPCTYGDIKKPKYIEYVWNNCNFDGLTIFLDNNMKDVTNCNSKYKVCGVIESKFVNSNIHELINDYEKYFDLILTHNKDIFNLYPEKTIFAPASACILDWNQIGIFKKNKLVSFPASAKLSGLEGYIIRSHIKNSIENKLFSINIDTFGSGFDKPFISKSICLKEYMFSICVENSKYDYYVTEKIFDVILSGCVPIYWGMPSISDIFDSNGMLIFNNIQELKEIIDNLTEEKYNQMFPYVKKNFNIAKKFIDWDDNIVKSIFEKLNISY